MKWSFITKFICGLFLVAFCLGLLAGWMLEAIWVLFAGWIFFLKRVTTEMALDWNGIVTAGICLFCLPIGLHLFLRWLYSQSSRADVESAPVRRWHVRWTAGVLAVVILTFTAGVSAVGIAHQSIWLATSPEPLAYGSLRDIASRTASASNIKQMATCVHMFHDMQKRNVSGGTFDKDGTGLHGWQTSLLPYMEQQQLYDRIKLDLPWHDPANSEIFKKQIHGYQYSIVGQEFNASGFALSHYASNVRVIGGGTPLTMKEIMDADGLSNTLLLGEAAGNYKPWGHHANWRDPALGINKTADGFGNPKRAGAQFAFADGSVHFISDKVSPSILKALSTPNGGEKIRAEDWQQ